MGKSGRRLKLFFFRQMLGCIPLAWLKGCRSDGSTAIIREFLSHLKAHSNANLKQGRLISLTPLCNRVWLELEWV